jgi:hypothetical protein
LEKEIERRYGFQDIMGTRRFKKGIHERGILSRSVRIYEVRDKQSWMGEVAEW